MNITKLLRALFRSFLLYADGDAAAPAGGGDAPAAEGSDDSDVIGLLSGIVDAGEDFDPDNTAGEGGDAPGDAATKDGEQAQADDPNDPLLTITIDGTQRQVKQSELLINAQKYEAGAKRLEEAAAERQALQPEKAAIQQERLQLRQALDTYIPHLTQILQASLPDPQLIDSNPQEYMRQNYVHQQRMAELAQAQAAQAELTRREQFEQAQQLQTRSAVEQTKLLDALPDWKDPAKAKTEASAVDGYLQQAGFNDQERNGIVDHRIVVVARKAMLYDQLVQQQAQATQRVQKLPAKVERSGNGVRPSDTRVDALQRHSRAGTVESGADALMQLLE